MTEDINTRYAESFKRKLKYLKKECEHFTTPVEKETYKNAKAFLSMLPMRDLLRHSVIESNRAASAVSFKWGRDDDWHFGATILENNKITFGYVYPGHKPLPIIPFDRNEIPKTVLYKLNLLRK